MPYPVPLTSGLFSPADLELLLSPRRWRLVGSAFPPDSRPVRDAAHRKWARRHTDIHANREGLFVLNGSGSVDFLGSTYRLEPGSVFFFDSMEPHDQGYPAWCAAAQHLWMTFIHDRCIIRLIDVGRGPRHYQQRWRRLFTLQAMGLSSQRDLFPTDQRLELPAAVLHGRALAAMSLLMAGLAAQACRPQTGDSTSRSSAFQPRRGRGHPPPHSPIQGQGLRAGQPGAYRRLQQISLSAPVRQPHGHVVARLH